MADPKSPLPGIERDPITGLINGNEMMLVIRDQQVIGHVKVVDVREKIAGAVIQDLVSQTKQFKIGDHVNVAAVQ